MAGAGGAAPATPVHRYTPLYAYAHPRMRTAAHRPATMITYAPAMEFRDDLPRWQQIATAIRRRIENGEYNPGRLISENALMQEFGVARNTARKAVAHLREKGYLYTRPNLGSFVGPEPEDDE